MRILLPENIPFEMTELPNEIQDDLRYCVLDYSDQNNVDFLFFPLFFLESFPRPSADLRIGKYRIQVPLDWSVIIAEKDFGYVEVIDLKHLNDREFTAFCLNPITSYIPDFLDISIENIYSDVHWHVPSLKHGHILAVPLSGAKNPTCAFFVKDTNKIPESLDIAKIFT